jgi:hypothetical protein
LKKPKLGRPREERIALRLAAEIDIAGGNALDKVAVAGAVFACMVDNLPPAERGAVIVRHLEVLAEAFPESFQFGAPRPSIEQLLGELAGTPVCLCGEIAAKCAYPNCGAKPAAKKSPWEI